MAKIKRFFVRIFDKLLGFREGGLIPADDKITIRMMTAMEEARAAEERRKRKGNEILGIAGEDLGAFDIVKKRKDGRFYKAHPCEYHRRAKIGVDYARGSDETCFASVDRIGDQYFVRGGSIIRKENEMNYKLNTNAIKRMFEGAVVCGYDDDEIRIMLPAEQKGYFFDIVKGSYDEIISADWIIKPGDKCEVSDDGRIWVKHTFGGFFGSPEYPFMVAGMEEEWKHIRPVPQLTERQKRIQNMEQELNELKKLEGME